MKDIDFDELDRAVNSVLGTPTRDDSEDLATTTHSTEPSTGATTTSTAPQSDTATPAPQKDLVQKRRTGRFMDVVPQSSRTKNATARPIVSRQAPTIAPIAEPSPREEPLEPARETDASTPEAGTTFDPLDFQPTDSLSSHGALDDERHEAKIALDQAAGELASLNGLMHDEASETPLDTPFMNDLTLEKRPLGAFSLGETDGSLLEEDAKTYQAHVSGEESHGTSKDIAAEIDTHMNDALARELSGESEVDPTPDTQEAKVQIEDKPTLAATGEDELPVELQDEMNAIASMPVNASESNDEPKPKKTQEPAATQPIGGGSIPTQYKTQMKAQSEEITPVFDTDNYHQPLLHAKKKKSGWLSVVIITTLVLVGVGLGAAVYFFDPFGLL